MSISSTVFFLSTNFTLHIAFTIDLSALLKITTSFSLKYLVLLQYNIVILHSFYIPFLLSFTKRIFFFSNSISSHSEFLPSHSCSCSYCSFTSSTGIQPITKIAKSLHSFHFITHYFLLHFSHTICYIITFNTNKQCCQTRSYWSHFVHSTKFSSIINMVSVQNPLVPFCCVLGTLRHYPLLGGLGKQF